MRSQAQPVSLRNKASFRDHGESDDYECGRKLSGKDRRDPTNDQAYIGHRSPYIASNQIIRYHYSKQDKTRRRRTTSYLDGVPEIGILEIGQIFKRVGVPVDYHAILVGLLEVFGLVAADKQPSTDQTGQDEQGVYGQLTLTDTHRNRGACKASSSNAAPIATGKAAAR